MLFTNVHLLNVFEHNKHGGNLFSPANIENQIELQYLDLRSSEFFLSALAQK